MNRQTLLLIVLVILNLADIATTLCGLGLGGTELNPLFTPERIPFKVAITIAYAFLFLGSFRSCRKRGFMTGLRILDVNLAVLILFYLMVVANNSIGILGMLWEVKN